MDMNLFLKAIEKLGPAAISLIGGRMASGTLSDAARDTSAARQEAGGNATKLLTDIMGDQTGQQNWAYGQGTELNKYGFDETNAMNKWAFENAVGAKNTGINNARAALNEGMTGALGYLNPYAEVGNKALAGLGASVSKYPGGVGKSFSEKETTFPTVAKLSYKDFSTLNPPTVQPFQGALGKGLTPPPSVDMSKFLISSGQVNNDAEQAVRDAMGEGAIGEGASTASTLGKVATGATLGSVLGMAVGKLAPQALKAIGLASLGGPVGALIGAGIMGVQALIGHFTKLGGDKEAATRGIDALTKINQSDWLPKVKSKQMTEAQYQVVLQAAFNDWAKLLPGDVHERSIDSQLYWWNKGLVDNGFKFQLEMPGHEANVNAGKPGYDQEGNPN